MKLITLNEADLFCKHSARLQEIENELVDLYKIENKTPENISTEKRLINERNEINKWFISTDK